MPSKWKTKDLSDLYVNNVRGAIPLAKAQIEIMLKIIRYWNPNIKKVIDLGCGNGILGKAILLNFPKIDLFCLDFSESMLDSAKNNFNSLERVNFVNADFSSYEWIDSLKSTEGFDLIISGFSIHHQPDKRKKEIYKEIYNLLNPNGIFLNLEHISSPTESIESLFEDYFIDHLYSYQGRNNKEVTRDSIAEKYYNRPDKKENLLAPLETQCNWLKEIGYLDVDCFFKVFELAIFGGRK